MTTFSVTFSDPTGQFTAQAAAIQADVLYAASIIARWVPGLGDIAISIVIDPSVPTAIGASATSVLAGTVNGFQIYSQGMASEMATGIDPNGASPDVLIRVGSTLLASSYWVDPTPETSSDLLPTSDDFVSVMLHELMHGLAFSGWRTGPSASLPADYMSTYDQNVVVTGGAPFFVGATALAVYGAPVPLSPTWIYHYGAPADGYAGLLNGVENGNPRLLGVRYGLNDLDLAMLQDSGIHISHPTTGTAGADVLHSALAGVFSGLDGNDVLSGSLFADTLDGGSGLDTVVYSGLRAAYSLVASGGGFALSSIAGSEGTDLLLGVERIHFADRSLALDLDGNAGKVAELLGAAFGHSFVHDPTLAGIGISLMDTGMTFQQLAAAAVATDTFASLAGSHGNADFVTFIYRNVVGVAPSASDLAYYKGLLDSGQFTQGALAVLAAETNINKLGIDLVGLQHTGLEYV